MPDQSGVGRVLLSSPIPIRWLLRAPLLETAAGLFLPMLAAPVFIREQARLEQSGGVRERSTNFADVNPQIEVVVFNDDPLRRYKAPLAACTVSLAALTL